MAGNNIFILALTGILLFALQSCTKHELPPQQYISWVSDYSNRLHKKKQVDNIVFDVQFSPIEMVALKESYGTNDFTSFHKRLEELKALQYFVIKISVANNSEDFMKQGINSEKDFYNRLYYYSFNFQNDIYLEEKDKIVPCHLFHFERSYDLTSARTFVVAFQNTGESGDKTLVIESKDLALGSVKIAFEKNDLISIPELKL